MSIYIKGMEMPMKENAVILITPSGDVWMMGDMPNEDTHLVKAKAVSMPPHGRLIDADMLGIRDEEKQAYEAYLQEKGEFYAEEPLLEYLRGRLEGLTNASGRVRFAPTIIPAEEDE